MPSFGTDKVICECACSTPDHLLVFHYYEDDEEPFFDTIDVYFTSRWWPSFWERLKYAFKYVIKGQPFLLSDAVVFDNRNLKQLKQAIRKIEKRQNNYIKTLMKKGFEEGKLSV